MIDPAHAPHRELALRMLTRSAGPAATAEAMAAAVEGAYGDLARVLAAVIGDGGVTALTDRALFLVKNEYAWFSPPHAADHASASFADIVDALRRVEPAVAAEAAAAMFGTILELLVTFIGEPLASRLVRQAWPDTPSDGTTKET